MAIRFSLLAMNKLPEDIRHQVKKDLAEIIPELVVADAGEGGERPPEVPGDDAGEPGPPERDRDPSEADIYVLSVFSGHTPEYDRKVVLGIEFTHRDRYERHIVKIGDRAKVGRDYTNWRDCTRGQQVASRIFAPVRRFTLGADRVAVLYRDAFTLFGPENPGSFQSQPVLLEDAAEWAALDDKPDPMSVERALAHIYTDLGVWFYQGAGVRRDLAHDFYAGHLRQRPKGQSVDVLDRWQNDPDRRLLRRQAVWVLAGRDVPDADPVTKSAHYLDPVEYVRWAMAGEKGSRLPATLVGRSHGDLHARNVLVGVRRGEVQYPAVFDYGDMSDRNVLAWDFAKLETELKVRLLPRLRDDEEVLDCLIGRTGLRLIPSSSPKTGTRSENGRRADRLAAFLAFEELLDHFSRAILDKSDAERIAPFRVPPTGVAKIDRLLAILLRVRREASFWLGFDRGREPMEWMDEFYFALGVYGLLNVRWRYTRPEQESALVSSGVAIARMSSTPRLLEESIAKGGQSWEDYPSYRVPLALIHASWKSKDHEIGLRLGRAVAINPGEKLEVHPLAYHAVPLIGHALLLESEDGDRPGVEDILEDLRRDAHEFGDFETLARIGRLFKNSGDRRWSEAARYSEESATRATWLHMYDKAREVYVRAFEVTRNHYVGINAATLARLTHKPDQAERLAREVAKICAELHDADKDERHWIFATQGEAALILGDENARDFYRDALAELTPANRGAADSMYKQACRLWRILGDDRVGPVLRAFEEDRDIQHYLTPNFLGRDFSVASPGR